MRGESAEKRPEERENAEAGREPIDMADVGLYGVVAPDCRALQVTESALVGRAIADVG